MNIGPAETSIIIALFSLLLATLGWRRNSRNDDKADAGQITTVIVKLENISNDIKEVKNDTKDLRKELKEVSDRLTRTEESAKQAHKRIDHLEDRIENDYTKEV